MCYKGKRGVDIVSLLSIFTVERPALNGESRMYNYHSNIDMVELSLVNCSY